MLGIHILHINQNITRFRRGKGLSYPGVLFAHIEKCGVKESWILLEEVSTPDMSLFGGVSNPDPGTVDEISVTKLLSVQVLTDPNLSPFGW